MAMRHTPRPPTSDAAREKQMAKAHLRDGDDGVRR